MNLLSLEQRRSRLKLCLLYKIIHNLCYFPSDFISLRYKFIIVDQTPCHSINPLLKQMLICTSYNIPMELIRLFCSFCSYSI